MHENDKKELRLLREQAMLRPAGRRRQRALNGLGEIHFDWHTTRRTYGFLLFHADVIRQVKAVSVPARFGGVRPFSREELSGFWAEYHVTAQVGRGATDALRRRRGTIRSWR